MAWATSMILTGNIYYPLSDDLIRFRMSKVKVIVGRRGGQGIHMDAGASKSIL